MPSAEIKKQIIQLDISGDANDGDPATPPEHYPAPPRLGHKLIKGIERSRYRGVIGEFC